MYQEVTCSNGKNVHQLLDNVVELERRSRLEGGYTVVGAFRDITTQLPDADTTDTLTPVRVGLGGITADGVISIDGDGVMTAAKAGPWFLKARARVGRTGAAGVSEVFFQFYTRPNAGAPWAALGESIDIKLDSSNQTVVVLDESFFRSVVGAQYYLGWARSSEGNNSGSLMPGIPSAALTALGVAISPSMQMSIATKDGFDYQ